ncbi:hypothetical protein [Pedobacter montanisoli]|uniref:Bacteriocin n=1 Tax=Pedobacter montanisoli TaxID=2923277 RepID=A0ABS9ZRN3_9SPHI|nr:hypothetical protein [Pedobacter montanisoli]MCJ0741235.1 hypothetical protein [Pedobacter montanisoli]
MKSLSRSEMKKIMGGDDQVPALCKLCIEAPLPYHGYSEPPCLEWHCPIEDPVPEE